MRRGWRKSAGCGGKHAGRILFPYISSRLLREMAAWPVAVFQPGTACRHCGALSRRSGNDTWVAALLAMACPRALMPLHAPSIAPDTRIILRTAGSKAKSGTTWLHAHPLEQRHPGLHLFGAPDPQARNVALAIAPATATSLSSIPPSAQARPLHACQDCRPPIHYAILPGFRQLPHPSCPRMPDSTTPP